MKHTVRLGIVGLGKFAVELAQKLELCESASLTACYTRTPEKRQRFSEQFGCQPFDSFDDLCHADIDGVILVTPNDVHCEQTLALAAAGKHLFVEKPLCNTLSEATQMIDACDSANVLLAVGHQERRHSAFREMKRRIESGELGRIHAFAANHCGYLIGIWPEDDWRFSADQGVGPILHKGIHKIDILNYLFGEAQQVGTIGTSLSFNPDVLGTAVSTIAYENNIIGSLSSGFCHTDNSLSIYGEKHSILYSGHGRMIRIKNEKTWETNEFDCGPDDPIGEELTEFVDAIRDDASIEVDGHAAREAVLLGVMAGKAAKTGRTESIQEERVRFESDSVRHLVEAIA